MSSVTCCFNDLSLKNALLHLKNAFQKTGFSGQNALRETKLLAEAALHLTAIDLMQKENHLLSTFPGSEKFTQWAGQRLAGMPLSRLKGSRGFYEDTFIISPDTLDPRPESETVISTAKNIFSKHAPATILELGVGSGCLLLTLLRTYPQAQGWGTDLSKKALDITTLNAKNLTVCNRLTLTQGHWFQALEKSNRGRSKASETLHPWPHQHFSDPSQPDTLRFDLIVSNPPYIQTDVIPKLDAAVKNYDPILALDGGADGLQAYNAILPHARSFLTPRGALLLEIGSSQGQEVKDLAEKFFSSAHVLKDLSGHDRVIHAHNPPEKTPQDT